ncbi:hypothetical protein ISCGN_002620 [Ixodes scapularis]
MGTLVDVYTQPGGGGREPWREAWLPAPTRSSGGCIARSFRVPHAGVTAAIASEFRENAAARSLPSLFNNGEFCRVFFERAGIDFCGARRFHWAMIVIETDVFHTSFWISSHSTARRGFPGRGMTGKHPAIPEEWSRSTGDPEAKRLRSDRVLHLGSGLLNPARSKTTIGIRH